MKSDDLAIVVFLTVVGAAVAFVLANTFLGNLEDASVSFKRPMAITSTLEAPDPEVFNLEAINPTVEVYVGNCQDDDHNGILSEAELEACGEAGWITDK